VGLNNLLISRCLTTLGSESTEVGLGGKRVRERLLGRDAPAVAGRRLIGGVLLEPLADMLRCEPLLFAFIRNTGDAARKGLISVVRCILSCSLRAMAEPNQGAFFLMICILEIIIRIIRCYFYK
jgi:hypothetical protein